MQLNTNKPNTKILNTKNNIISISKQPRDIKYENLNIEVIKMKSRRIESVKITVLPKEVIE